MKKMHAMKNFFSKVRRNQDGAAATEFALTAPLLITVFVAIMEFAMILFLSALLEGSLRDGARVGITGYSPEGFSRQEHLISTLNRKTLGLLNIDDDNVTTLAYSDFSEVGQPEPYIDENGNGQYDPGEPFTDVNGNGQWDADMGIPGLGGACDVVVYRIETQWPLMLGLLANAIGNPFTIRASTAVRNEPYGNEPC